MLWYRQRGLSARQQTVRRRVSAADCQAALALDMIERDLHAAAFLTDGQTWLAVDVINVPVSLSFHGWLTSESMKPSGSESQRVVPDTGGAATPSISDARFGLSGTWLRLFTGTPAKN